MSGLRARLSGRALPGLGLLLFGMLAVPVGAQQQKPSGAEVWAANCARCHRMRAADAYTASQWDAIVTQMALNARMTPDETEAVRQFLVEGARARQASSAASGSVAPSVGLVHIAYGATTGLRGSVPGEVLTVCSGLAGREIFKLQCEMCHGAKGKGNGPAAAGLSPRPANLSDVARMAKLSDDSLIKVVTSGRNAMPAYGKILTPEQVRDLVVYVRCLSGGLPSPATGAWASVSDRPRSR